MAAARQKEALRKVYVQEIFFYVAVSVRESLFSNGVILLRN